MGSTLLLYRSQMFFVSNTFRFGYRPAALLNNRKINNELTICTADDTCHSNGEFVFFFYGKKQG